MFISLDSLKPLSNEIMGALSNAKVAVSLASPLQAYHMFNCEFYECDMVPTAGATTDKNTNVVMFNPEFYMRLTNTKRRAFVLLHEISHIFQEHGGRQELMGYDPRLWNIATDYQINLFCNGAYLDEKGNVAYCTRYKTYIEMPTFEEDGIKILYDERFIGMSSDEIYHLLLEENDNDVEKAIEAHGGGVVGGDDSGSPSPLDGVSTDIPSTEHTMKNRRVSSAAIAKGLNEKSIGDSEGDMVSKLSDLFKPKINWREQLPEIIQNSVQEYETYNRISRRSPEDFFFPTYNGHSVCAVFGFDSSGSMSQDDYNEVAGELSGVVNEYDSWQLDLVSCDVKAHILGRYNSDDNPDFTTKSISFNGGGGTEMSPMIHYAQELYDLEGEVNVCIIITDGYIPVEPVENAITGDFPVILVVTSNGNSNLVVNGADIIFMKDIGR